MEKTCKNCDLVFNARYSKYKFCSNSCANKFNRKGKTIGKEQQRKMLQSRMEKIPENTGHKRRTKCNSCKKDFCPDKKNRKYCSNKCRDNGRGAVVRNEVSYRTFKKMVSRAFPDWRCPFCGWNSHYDIHHINGRKVENANDIDNLVLLCPNHHWMADNDLVSKESLSEFAIGRYFSRDEFYDKFYFGKNKHNIQKMQTQTDKTVENKKLNSMSYKKSKVEL